jgi:hypothetical protein
MTAHATRNVSERPGTKADPRYPDLFIVGAPRCGTTFMYEYLKAHPQIFMSAWKEPQFFATDLDSGSYLDSLTFLRDTERYLGLFSQARHDQITGEGSTWYLYSLDAARNIHAVNPNARIIAMLRNPVQMLYSLHGRRVYGGSEDIGRFEDALAAEADRKRGERLPARPRNVKALFYREVGKYAEQLERYIETFGRAQVHVIIFEELRTNPTLTYRAALEFLGVDPDFTPALRPVNESVERRSWRIQQLLLSPRAVRLARALLPVRARPYVGRAWDAVNTRGQRRDPLDPEVARQLYADLLPDMLRLGDMLGRDVTSIWTPVGP